MTPIPERDTAWNIPGATLDWKEQIKREGFEKQRITVYNTRSPTCEPLEQGLRGPTVRIDRHALVLSKIAFEGNQELSTAIHLDRQRSIKDNATESISKKQSSRIMHSYTFEERDKWVTPR